MINHKVKYFLTVIEEGSFSAAARKLYLSQPALSKQISALENELNIELLDRTGYRPVLTKAGKIYYEKVKVLQEQYEELLHSIHEQFQQNIKIAFTGSFENRGVLQAIHSIEKEFLNANLSFFKCGFDDSLKRLLDKEVDVSFGIESTFKNNPAVNYHILYHYDMCVICSFDHPLAKESNIDIGKIKKEKMILLSKKFGKSFYKDFMEACRLDGFKPCTIKEVDTIDELTFEVSIGNGIAIVSKDVVRYTEVKAIELVNSHHANNYVIAYLKNNENEGIHNFVNKVKRYFLAL